MLTAVIALALVGVALLILFAAMALAYRGSLLHIAELEDTVRSQLAELDALSIAGPPPAAVAAMQPDAEPPIPAGWLDDLNTLPTTYDREYPR